MSDLGVHSTTFDPELRNERFTLISFMQFPVISSALQPFQICIFNRKYSKLAFWNGCQLMGQRFMANLHTSLDSTCKSRISKISTRCLWGIFLPLDFEQICSGRFEQICKWGREFCWQIWANLQWHFSGNLSKWGGGVSANRLWANLRWHIWANLQTGGDFCQQISANLHDLSKCFS